MSGARRGLLPAAALAAAAFSAAAVLHAAWIPLKAELAQWLIERAWRLEQSGQSAPPWPWADTRAAALLEVPRLRQRLVVLQGNSGRNLAFGPVLMDGTRPGHDAIISGHRDTHFAFLRDLRQGDRLRLKARESERWYEVSQVDVIDSRQAELVLEPGVDRVSLVTCFPFDATAAGGPLRYVVSATPVAAPVAPRADPALTPRSRASG